MLNDSSPQVFVDGPFGAPAQDHDDYNVMILVGAGIGVTPFASVLNDILDNMKKGRCPNCGHIGSSFNVKKVGGFRYEPSLWV